VPLIQLLPHSRFVAALLVPGSRITLPNIGLNPRRTGLIETLIEMGCNIRIENRRSEAGEPVGDLVVASAELRGVEVPASRAPAMIDEYLVLGVAAACARGKDGVCAASPSCASRRGDRLAALANGLAACGRHGRRRQATT